MIFLIFKINPSLRLLRFHGNCSKNLRIISRYSQRRLAPVRNIRDERYYSQIRLRNIPILRNSSAIIIRCSSWMPISSIIAGSKPKVRSSMNHIHVEGGVIVVEHVLHVANDGVYVRLAVVAASPLIVPIDPVFGADSGP